MRLKCGGMRREAGDTAGEVVGDKSGGALWAMEDCLAFVPSGGR